MAGKRKEPVKKTTSKEPSLEMDAEDGFWYIKYPGGKKVNVGRSRRYAEKMLADA